MNSVGAFELTTIQDRIHQSHKKIEHALSDLNRLRGRGGMASYPARELAKKSLLLLGVVVVVGLFLKLRKH
jgi:hypothetical protein